VRMDAAKQLGQVEVAIKRDSDGTYLAYNDEVYTHGVGATPIEAVQDFLDALEDKFLEYSRDEMILEDHLAVKLYYLRTIFL